MPLRCRDVKLTSEAREELRELEEATDKTSRSVARRVRALRAALLTNCLHGEVVGKGSIPKVLRERYQIENLYVEDLPSFWRLLYTVVKEAGDRYVVVLRIVDHPTYSRWFPGRGR